LVESAGEPNLSPSATFSAIDPIKSVSRMLDRPISAWLLDEVAVTVVQPLFSELSLLQIDRPIDTWGVV
jgi:hypothetical protein